MSVPVAPLAVDRTTTTGDEAACHRMQHTRMAVRFQALYVIPVVLFKIVKRRNLFLGKRRFRTRRSLRKKSMEDAYD